MLKRIITRADFTRAPTLPLPFYVRSAGEYNLPPGHVISYHFPRPFVQIFWTISGGGNLRLGKTVYKLTPGCVLWKLPAEGQEYHAGSEGLHLRWFTLDGKMASSIIKNYRYPRRKDNAGLCPTHLFAEIESGLQEPGALQQPHLISVALEILARAGAQPEAGGNDMAARFMTLAQKKFADAGMNVNILARQLGVHRCTLTRQFQEKMRLSPGEYFAGLRLSHALKLLRETDLSISEVGRLSGLPGRSYFSRAIKKAAGLSPRTIRQQTEKSF